MQVPQIFKTILDVLRLRHSAFSHASHTGQEMLLDEHRDLAALKTISFPRPRLKSISSGELQRMLHDPLLLNDWKDVAAALQELKLPEMTGGVNPGDQRAIYYLIRGLRPQSILEIGTHIGCSTLNMALASRHHANASICTVDIRDVNDAVTRPWESFGATYSPAELMLRRDCQDLVHFRVSQSLEFLRNTDRKEKYDFIFLDGDHSATTVYQELPAALKCLAENGVVLLHDFFPDAQPLWSDGSIVPGVFLATQRLQNEGASFNVIPLGKLPWSTKLNSNVTSLALVTASDRELKDT